MIRLRIDEALCTGNGRCHALFPELFGDDERGYGRVLSEQLGDERLDHARRAEIACPERAISVTTG
jgi:ferredoxin